MEMMMNTLGMVGAMRMLGAEDLLDHVTPHPLFKVGPLVVTNHMMMVVLAGVLVFLIFSWVGLASKKTKVPTGFHNFFEAMLSFFRTEVFRPALGDNADRFTPFLWTVFFFVLFCNLLGIVPIGEVITLASHGKLEHAWGTATSGLSVTAALAFVAFITVHISGIIQQVRIKMDPSLAPHHHGEDHAQPRGHGQMTGSEGIEDERDVVLEHRVGDGHDHAHGLHHSEAYGGQPFGVAVFTGIGSYIWNFAPHPQAGGVFMDLMLFIGLLALEMVGSIVKPFSLCIRLFANMVAGHLVPAALIGLIPFGVAAAWAATGGVGFVVIAGCTALGCLDLFVAFLQAYIFTFLVTLYIATAVSPEH
jgi:F0F1-type ATP synthase membrane subunit a